MHRRVCPRLASVVLAALTCACSGSTTTSPTGTTPRQTIAGRITALPGGEAIAGAAVSAFALQQQKVTGTTDGSGAYTLSVPGGAAAWSLNFVAPGYVDRSVPWGVSSRDNSSATMIALAPPFSLDYYRQLVRGALDHGGSDVPLARWTQAPKFFVITRTIDTGDPVPDVAIDIMQGMAARETPPLTGGQFDVAQFARGETPPADANGWIVVKVYAGAIPNQPGAGGSSAVGANPGTIRVRLDMTPVPSCGYLVAGAFYHEIVHALGYWHTSEGFSVDNQCNALLPNLVYHARIAYARPIGNRDPDVDPQ